MRLILFTSFLLLTLARTSGFLIDLNPSPVNRKATYDGVTFLMVAQTRTWQQAREDCRYRGLDLFVHNNDPAVQAFVENRSVLDNLNRATCWHRGGRTCDDLQQALCSSYLYNSNTGGLQGQSEPLGSSMCQRKAGFLCSNSCRRTLSGKLPATTVKPPTTTTKKSNCRDLLNDFLCRQVVSSLQCLTVGSSSCRKTCGFCTDSKGETGKSTLPPSPTTTADPRDCSARADVMFVIDSSGSIGPTNFQTMLQFVNTVISDFKIGPDDVQVGIIRYSTLTHQIVLNKYHSLTNLQSAISKLSYTDGKTYTGNALEYMTATSFTTRNGGRAGVPKIAIVITDGVSMDDVYILSNAARNHGIKIFSVGIGEKVDHAQLNAMASRPFNQHVFNVQSFQGLDSIKSAVTAQLKLCEATPKPTTTTTPNPTQPPTTNSVTTTLKPTTSTSKPTQTTTELSTESTTVTNSPSTEIPVSPTANSTLDKVTVTPMTAGSQCTWTCTPTSDVNTNVTQLHTTPEYLSNTTTTTFSTTTESPTTVPTTTTAAATSTTPGTPGCVDTFKDCASLGSRVCAGLTTWAQEHCAAYCGFCHVTTPCQDEKNCGRYGDTICSAASLSTWVDENCRKFCNRC